MDNYKKAAIIEIPCPCNTCSIPENGAFDIKCCRQCRKQITTNEDMFLCICNLNRRYKKQRLEYAKENNLKIHDKTLFNFLVDKHDKTLNFLIYRDY